MQHWQASALDALPVEDGVRLRGASITRLEALTDAAFALALTHLVIAIGYIPRTYPELIEAFKQIPAFAASFVILILVWRTHVRWSRYYGLEDSVSTLLSCALIFVVLVFVYPLKIVMASFFHWVSNGWLPAQMDIASYAELQSQFVIYAAGYLAVAGVTSGLYARAARCRVALALNAGEYLMTRARLQQQLLLAAVSLLALLLALLLPTRLSFLSPSAFGLLPVLFSLNGRWRARRERALAAT